MTTSDRTDELLSLLHRACKPLSELAEPVQMAAYRQLLFTAGHVDVNGLVQGLEQVAVDLRGLAAAAAQLITHTESAAGVESALGGLADVVARAAAALAAAGKPGPQS